MALPKGDVKLLPLFKPGDHVELSRVRHAEFQGLTGIVVKTVKSRGTVEVRLIPSTRMYSAFPENLTRLKGA